MCYYVIGDNMSKQKISDSTLKRYPIYLKAVRKLKNNGVEKVMSHELSDLVKIKPTTIRRDFSLLGKLGKQGYGYDVALLEERFNEILGMNFEEKIIIVGVGNLGKALINYNKWDYVVGAVVAGFDINPEDKQDLSIPVYNVNDFDKYITPDVKIAILTVSEDIQSTVDKLVACGIIGIVNFTHEHINAPEGVVVREVDVVSSIQEIVFETSDRYNND